MKPLSLLTLSIGSLALSSCALLTKSEDKRTYYAFRSTAGEQIAKRPALSAHVRSVTIPGYLDRSELVSRTTPNVVDIRDRFLWAESLDNEIARNMAASLRSLLGTSKIVALDSELAELGKGYRINLEITRFELDTGNNVVLEGIYAIRNREASGDDTHKSFRFTKSGASNETAIVAAMNACLDELNRDVARKLADR